MTNRRQLLAALALATVPLTVMTPGCGTTRLSVGFWFEPVAYDASEAMAARLGGPLMSDELLLIEQIARQEFTRAFAGLPLDISDRHDAAYRVRVVQELRNSLAPNYPGPAGESRAVAGFGGQGAVNFRAMVSSAVVYAPDGSSRAAIVEAIGRGVGRTAVHELAHQLLGNPPIDATSDRLSYEFRSADRPEHFYGTLHWSNGWPRLKRRLGVP